MRHGNAGRRFNRTQSHRTAMLANLASSPPFLVIPVLQDAATRQAHESSSPWLAAWSNKA